MGPILQAEARQSLFSILLDQYSTCSQLINACTLSQLQTNCHLTFSSPLSPSSPTSQYRIFILSPLQSRFYRLLRSIQQPRILGLGKADELSGGEGWKGGEARGVVKWRWARRREVYNNRSKRMNNSNQNNIFDVIDFESMEYDEEEDQFSQVLDHEHQHCQEDEVSFYEREQLKKDLEEPSNTADTITEDHETPEDHSIAEELTTESPLPRTIAYLQTTPELDAKHAEVAHGQTRETQNLGKNYKTVVKNYLKVIHQGGYFEETQIDALRKFGDSNGGIRDFQELFQEPQLRKWGQELFSSPNLVREIMQSPKMDKSSKLIMLKYLPRLRSTTHSLHSKWKDDCL